MSETLQDPWATIDRQGAEEKAYYSARHQQEVATLTAERDRLRAAAQAVLDNETCADPDCCTAAIKHEAALQGLRAALSETAGDR